MICRKCQKEIPDGSVYCNFCGVEQNPKQHVKQRGNGQGTVYKRNGKWVAAVTLGYYMEDGRMKRKTRSRSYPTKREAVQALGELRTAKTAPPKISFKEAFDKAMAEKKPAEGYAKSLRSGMKHFSRLWHLPLSDVTILDLQRCVDGCGGGRGTKTIAKTAVSMTYQYAIAGGLLAEKVNLAQFIKAGGAARKKDGLPMSYLEALMKAVGKVKYADYVVCQCYLGFRPSELLALRVKDYDPNARAFVGGAKTEAGKNRTVTVSPKIQPLIEALIAGKSPNQYVFCGKNGKQIGDSRYRNMFYEALDKCGLENPTVGGNELADRRTYTPHSCRHTFATLVKRVDGADKDKLELIGHTDTKMLQHYQDVSLDDLRAITDKI